MRREFGGSHHRKTPQIKYRGENCRDLPARARHEPQCAEVHEERRRGWEDEIQGPRPPLVRRVTLPDLEPARVKRAVPVAVEHDVAAVSDHFREVGTLARISAAPETDLHELRERQRRRVHGIGSPAEPGGVHVISFVVYKRTVPYRAASQEVKYREHSRQDQVLHHVSRRSNSFTAASPENRDETISQAASVLRPRPAWFSMRSRQRSANACGSSAIWIRAPFSTGSPSAPIVVDTTGTRAAIASKIFRRVPPPVRRGTIDTIANRRRY